MAAEPEESLPVSETRWQKTTRSFRHADDKSMLAAAETVFAVAAYWSIALVFDTHRHLWLSVLAAPLLLLRSPPSVALGARWFRKSFSKGYANETKSKRSISRPSRKTKPPWTTFAVMVAVLIFFNFFLLSSANHGQWMLFLRSLTLGVLIMFLSFGIARALMFNALGALLTTSLVLWLAKIFLRVNSYDLAIFLLALTDGLAAYLFLLFVGRDNRQRIPSAITLVGRVARGLLSIPRALGMWLRAIGIRVVATAFFLWSGAKEVPANFRRTLLGTDFLSPAEFVPEVWEWSAPSMFAAAKNEPEIEYKIGFAIIGATSVVTAWLYRLSLKSTCWVYWPLAYVMKVPGEAGRPQLFLSNLLEGAWPRFQRNLAWVALGGFIVTNAIGIVATIISEMLIGSNSGVGIEAIRMLSKLPFDKIITPFEYLFLIDVRSLSLWTWLNLASAAITIRVLWYHAEFVRRRYEYAIDHHDDVLLVQTLPKVAALERFVLIKNLIGLALAAIYLVHAMLVLSPIWTCLPPSTRTFLSWFYGRWIPDQQSGDCFVVDFVHWMTMLQKDLGAGM